MPKVSFDQLLSLYRSITFAPAGDEGQLLIASGDDLSTMFFIEANDDAAADANIAVLEEISGLAVGKTIRVRVGPPKFTLGVLVRDLDGLLDTPEGRLSEPRAYFIIEGSVTRDATPVPSVLIAYRKVLELLSLITEAAAYLDRPQRELIFFKEGKFTVPVRYGSKDLEKVSITDADRLISSFSDEIHKDQKLAIFAEALMQLCASQPPGGRFRYLLSNLFSLAEEVRKGYQLFASSFSYAKIRSDLETARVDYLNKIHKTLLDIQGQLLGIPVATIIVASQLKLVSACSLEFWTNLAVVAGAWIFVLLLAIAILNQWATLSSIARDVGQQKTRLAKDYSTLSGQFGDIFLSLNGRIRWQRFVLSLIGIMAVVGACFATFVAYRLTGVNGRSCLRGDVPISDATAPPSVSTIAPASRSDGMPPATPPAVPAQLTKPSQNPPTPVDVKPPVRPPSSDRP